MLSFNFICLDRLLKSLMFGFLVGFSRYGLGHAQVVRAQARRRVSSLYLSAAHLDPTRRKFCEGGPRSQIFFFFFFCLLPKVSFGLRHKPDDPQ